MYVDWRQRNKLTIIHGFRPPDPEPDKKVRLKEVKTGTYRGKDRLVENPVISASAHILGHFILYIYLDIVMAGPFMNQPKSSNRYRQEFKERMVVTNALRRVLEGIFQR